MLLLGLAAQIVIGLVAHDIDGIEPGQLSYLVSCDMAGAVRSWQRGTGMVDLCRSAALT